MSDPDLDLIQQTHDAHAALMARINGFLDQVDGDVAAAIALAQAELSARQSAYDDLASDLQGVVAEYHDQVFYLDALSGDDAASGTSSGAPLATLAEVARRAPPGSRVAVEFLSDITINERVTLKDTHLNLILNGYTLSGGSEQIRNWTQSTIVFTGGTVNTGGIKGSMISANGAFLSGRYVLHNADLVLHNGMLVDNGSNAKSTTIFYISGGSVSLDPARDPNDVPIIASGLGSRQAYEIVAAQYTNSTGVPFADLFTGLSVGTPAYENAWGLI